MKKLLSAVLMIVMLLHTLPLEALASAGKVLSREELNRAYALTGLGTGGLAANGDGTYHDGMKPNASWNASQLRDWLDVKLDADLNTVMDLLSQAAYTLNELKERNPDAYARFTAGSDDNDTQRAYLQAEQLREELRYYQDQLTEASGVIAEYGRRMQEEQDSLFDSDRVRWSACIEEAEAEIVEIRRIIADNSADWERKINVLSLYVQCGPSQGEQTQDEWKWMNDLLFSGESPVTNTAKVTRVSAASSRMNRLSTAAGTVANDVDAKITVLSENEVGIVLQTGDRQKPVPLKGVSVKVRDALRKDAQLLGYTTNDNGIARIPVNQFKMDEFEIIHLYVEVDPRPQGYRDFVIEDLDMAKGEPYVLTPKPINGQSANGDAANAEGDVYPYMMCFNGRDIMNSQYDMIYNTTNDYEFEIKVGFRNTAGKNLPGLVMRYYGAGCVGDGAGDVYVEPTHRDGDVYTFKGKWKQLITPTAGKDKDRKPVTFMFGKDAAANLTFPSQLVSHRSATDAPIDEGTGSSTVFQTVLKKNFSLGFKIPKIDVMVNLDLPFVEYLPRININPGGYVTIFMGSAIFEDETKKLQTQWQSKDMRTYKQAEAYIEKKSTFANYKGRFNLAMDFYKTKAWKFMGSSSIDVGVFAVATGRWELDKDVPDVKSTNVSLRVGSGITLAYSFSWTISYPIGPVPVYVSFTLGIAAGFAIEHVLNFCWVNGGFQNWELRPFNGITISISISLSAALGVGIKGFLDAYVELSASLSVIIRLSVTSKTPSSITVEGEVELTVGATVFFVSFKKNWKLVEGLIWSSNATPNLLAHYMNADAQKGEQAQVTYAEPQVYPQLAKDAREIATTDSQTNVDSDFKVVEAGGKAFAFHLAKVKGKDGKTHNRVGWQSMNANGGTVITGSTQQVVEDEDLKKAPENSRDKFIQALAERDDYAFDVAADDRFVYVMATSAKRFDADGFPVRNDLSMKTQDFYYNQNMIAYTVVLESDGKGNLNHRLSIPAGHNRNFLFEGRAVAGYAENFASYSYDSFTDPRIDYVRSVSGEGKDAHISGFEMYGEMPTIAYKNDTASTGAIGFHLWQSGLEFLTDRNVASGMGNGYERTKVLNTLSQSDVVRGIETQYSPAMDFVAISQPKNGAEGDKAIEMYAYEMNRTSKENKSKTSIVLDKGDISNLVAVTKERRKETDTKTNLRFFYTKREKSKDGAEQNRLYGLVIEPVKGAGTNDFEFNATKYVYDAVIPTSHFDTVILNDVTYLYWVAAARKQKDSDPTLWRIWTMAFDDKTNTVLDPAVLAEFKLDKMSYVYRKGDSDASMTLEGKLDAAVSSAILLSSGTGYLNAVATNLEKLDERSRPKVAPIALYSFEEKLKPAANLISAIPRALAVRAGDFEDITLGIMNEGNIAISTFDIAIYEVVNGKQSDKPLETVHINGLDPKK